MSTGNIIAEQHCGSYKAFFWPVNWLLPPFERKRCLPVTDTHTYIQRKSQRLQTEYPHVDKLIGERNSRTTVSLGIFGNSLLLSVMSDWVVTLAQSVQQWRVTLIRKNRDRKAVSERERESWERERAESDEEEKEGQNEQRGKKSYSSRHTEMKKQKKQKNNEGSRESGESQRRLKHWDREPRERQHEKRRKGKEGGEWEERWFPRAPLKEGISGITHENWMLFIIHGASY